MIMTFCRQRTSSTVNTTASPDTLVMFQDANCPLSNTDAFLIDFDLPGPFAIPTEKTTLSTQQVLLKDLFQDLLREHP